MRLGKQPSRRDLALVGSGISYKAYERRFGRWSAALKSFVEYFNDTQIILRIRQPILLRMFKNVVLQAEI